MNARGGPDSEPGGDLSFLAPREMLADWRMVLAYGAAAEAGVLDALPGTLAEIAERCDLDEGALRAVLNQLAAWGTVAEDDQGHYLSGPRAPGTPDDAVLLVHAAVVRRWAALLGPRLRDRTAGSDEFPARPAPTGVGSTFLPSTPAG